MIEKILLATDGSQGALKAAQTAGELAQKFDADVLALYVILPVPVMLKLAGEKDESLLSAGSMAGKKGMEQAGEDILRRTAQVLEESGARYQTRLEHGHPAVTICDTAINEESDLIVVGQRSMKRAAIYVESISDRVSRCATCSVLVVR